jgi:hypothetical protein
MQLPTVEIEQEAAMEATMNRVNRSRSLAGGVFAGIIGGLVLSAILVGMAVWEGRDIWQAMKGAGLPFMDERATLPGFDLVPVLVGLAVHFGISIAWGLAFAILFFGASKAGTVALGAAWGLVVWVVMYYVVLQLAGLGEIARATPLGQAILLHVVFGLAIAMAFLPYQRPRRQREPTLAERLDASR